MLRTLGFNKFAKRHLPSDKGDFQNSTFSSGFGRKTQDALGYGIVGGGIGAVVGGVVGRKRALDSYQASVEPNSIKLEWETPDVRREVLGQIPRDERRWATFWERNSLFRPSPPSDINTSVRDVVVNQAALNESGQPVMLPQSQEFTGYGEPQVSWNEHSISHKELQGYDRSVTSRYDDQIFCQSNWWPPSDQKISQWCIKYSPKISTENVGSYKTPQVSFELPAEAASQLTAATMKGAGIGLVTGVALGVVGSLLMDRE